MFQFVLTFFFQDFSASNEARSVVEQAKTHACAPEKKSFLTFYKHIDFYRYLAVI